MLSELVALQQTAEGRAIIERKVEAELASGDLADADAEALAAKTDDNKLRVEVDADRDADVLGGDDGFDCLVGHCPAAMERR